MPGLPAPRPLPLSAYQRFGSPVPFATATVRHAIPSHTVNRYAAYHREEIIRETRGDARVRERRAEQVHMRSDRGRISPEGRGGETYWTNDRAGYGQYLEAPPSQVYLSEMRPPMETEEVFEESAEGTMFLPHYEGYSYMLIPSHLEDDVAGLILNAESSPVYTAPAPNPASIPAVVPETAHHQISAPVYESPNTRSEQTGALPAYRHPSPENTRLSSQRSQQADDLPAYRLPSPVVTRSSSVRSHQADDLPAYRSPVPTVSRTASVGSNLESDLPAYRAPSPIVSSTSTHTPTGRSVIPSVPASTLSRSAPLFATPAQPVASAISTTRGTPSDERPVHSILRVRTPVPGTTYPFYPNAPRNPDEEAVSEAFALAPFTHHNSRPPTSAAGHSTSEELLTEEEIFSFDINAYNARQAWRENQAEERRLRFLERQRIRESQGMGSVDVDAEEMYQLQEAIQMSLEEAENDGMWGWAAEGNEEEEEDEDLAEAIRRSTRESHSGRDWVHHSLPAHHPSAHPASSQLHQSAPHANGITTATNILPPQNRTVAHPSNAHGMLDPRAPHAHTPSPASRNVSIPPLFTQTWGGSTDTNKPLPGLPPGAST